MRACLPVNFHFASLLSQRYNCAMISAETKTDAPSAASARHDNARLDQRIARYVPLLVWVIVVMTVILIPAKIISYGYLPQDDALRHAAKAVSGKPWSEILVMRNDFLIDPHPGGHAVLGAVHPLTDWNTEKLVVFSVVGLMLLVTMAPLPWLRRPECWLAALLATTICVPRLASRLALGRPYLVTVATFIL